MHVCANNISRTKDIVGILPEGTRRLVDAVLTGSTCTVLVCVPTDSLNRLETESARGNGILAGHSVIHAGAHRRNIPEPAHN